jgi:hypothetical protein
MKYLVARGKTCVVGDGEHRGPGQEVEFYGEEAERLVKLGYIHAPGDFPVPGNGPGPSTNLDFTTGLQPQPKGFKLST